MPSPERKTERFFSPFCMILFECLIEKPFLKRIFIRFVFCLPRSQSQQTNPPLRFGHFFFLRAPSGFGEPKAVFVGNAWVPYFQGMFCRPKRVSFRRKKHDLVACEASSGLFVQVHALFLWLGQPGATWSNSGSG